MLKKVASVAPRVAVAASNDRTVSEEEDVAFAVSVGSGHDVCARIRYPLAKTAAPDNPAQLAAGPG